MLQNDGALNNSGIITGSGNYTQTGGRTFTARMSQTSINIQGGTFGLYVSLSAGDEYIGYYGTGTFKQTGGTNTVTNYLYLGYNSNRSGTHELSGNPWVGPLIGLQVFYCRKIIPGKREGGNKMKK